MENDDEYRILEEMKALIRFCEVTDNQELRMIVKRRLMKLSGIPVHNEWSIHNLDLLDDNEDDPVTDYSDRFTDNQLQMIKNYFKNPNTNLKNLGKNVGISENSSAHFLNRFFQFSHKERQLMLNKNQNL